MKTAVLTSLNEGYSAKISQQSIEHDADQQLVVDHLDALRERLISRPRRSFKERLGLTSTTTVGAQGLYMWGGVGRGKTFLMDLFYDALPLEAKRRVHFHRFMLEVHAHLHELRFQADPIAAVAARLTDQAQVLALDEFFVLDIGDAMILSGLLHELFQRAMVLVSTSNVAPDKLYWKGLQRQRFLPAIELINTQMQVIEIGGTTDYRRKRQPRAKVYFIPSDEHAEDALYSKFVRLCNNSPCTPGVITVNGREIQTRACADAVAWFDFEALCVGPRSKADYAVLSRRFHTILISQIPQLSADDENTVRRFIELVDELYDRRVKVVAAAATTPELLYRGKRQRQDFERLVSRMHEFATWDYLNLTHRP